MVSGFLSPYERVAFTGKAGVGKTTSANYLALNYGFQVISFAGKLKEIARELFPEAFENGEKPRVLFKVLGAKMREIDPDVWAKYLVHQLKPNVKYAIDDLQYKNEEWYVKQNGFVIIKIIGPQRVSMPPGAKKHPSELEVDLIKPDFVIENLGTLNDLYRQIDKIIFN